MPLRYRIGIWLLKGIALFGASPRELERAEIVKKSCEEIEADVRRHYAIASAPPHDDLSNDELQRRFEDRFGSR